MRGCEMKSLCILIITVFLIISCEVTPGTIAGMPDECNGTCESAHDINSLKDAFANAIDNKKHCICISETTIEAALTIAKPVTLVGKGRGVSTLKMLGASPLTIAASGVTLYGLNIVSDTAAVSASGIADLTIRNCRIEVTTPTDETKTAFAGVFDGVTALSIINSEITGANKARTAALYLNNTKASFENLLVQNLTIQGILAENSSQLVWKTGELRGIATQSAALFLINSGADLSSVGIKSITTPTTGGLLGGRGIIVTGTAATLKTSELSMESVASIGILADSGAVIALTDSAIATTGGTGVWLQKSPAQDKTHASLIRTIISKASGAGFVSLDSCGTLMNGSAIELTAARSWKETQIGDGIVLSGSDLASKECHHTFENLILKNNSRAGFIADGITEGNQILDGITFKNIAVRTTTQPAVGIYGLVFQNGTVSEEAKAQVFENPFIQADAALQSPLSIQDEVENISE